MARKLMQIILQPPRTGVFIIYMFTQLLKGRTHQHDWHKSTAHHPKHFITSLKRPPKETTHGDHISKFQTIYGNLLPIAFLSKLLKNRIAIWDKHCTGVDRQEKFKEKVSYS